MNYTDVNRALQRKAIQNVTNKVNRLLNRTGGFDRTGRLIFSSDTTIYLNISESKGLIVLNIGEEELFKAISNALPITGGGNVYLLIETRYINEQGDGYDILTMPMTSWNVTAYRYEENSLKYDVIHYTTKFPESIIIDSALAVNVDNGSEIYQLNNNESDNPYPLKVNIGSTNVTAKIIGKAIDQPSGFTNIDEIDGIKDANVKLKVSMYYQQ